MGEEGKRQRRMEVEEQVTAQEAAGLLLMCPREKGKRSNARTDLGVTVRPAPPHPLLMMACQVRLAQDGAEAGEGPSASTTNVSLAIHQGLYLPQL